MTVVDSIEDSDVRRVDQNVDPTALNPDDVAEELPNDFSRSAKRAFGERVAQERDAVRSSVDLSKRITRNPANNQPQLQGPDGRFGPSVDRVEGTSLDNDGSFYAELDDGSRFQIDTVDLQAGAEGRRQENPEW